MNEAEFNDQLDSLFDEIEDAVEDLDADIDADNSGGVLTLNCPDGSAIIFSRQSASRELWVAARSGGFHLGWDGERWYCARSEEDLATLLARVTREQIGEALELD